MAPMLPAPISAILLRAMNPPTGYGGPQIMAALNSLKHADSAAFAFPPRLPFVVPRFGNEGNRGGKFRGF